MRTYGNGSPLGNWGDKREPVLRVAGTGFTVLKHPGMETTPYFIKHGGRYIGFLSGYRTLGAALKAALGPNPERTRLELAAVKAVRELVKESEEKELA